MTADDLYRLGTLAGLIALLVLLHWVDRLTRARDDDAEEIVADCPHCHAPLDRYALFAHQCERD